MAIMLVFMTLYVASVFLRHDVAPSLPLMQGRMCYDEGIAGPGTNSESCFVCKQPIKRECLVRVGPPRGCRHVFHTKCIDPVIRHQGAQARCPACRSAWGSIASSGGGGEGGSSSSMTAPATPVALSRSTTWVTPDGTELVGSPPPPPEEEWEAPEEPSSFDYFAKSCAIEAKRGRGVSSASTAAQHRRLHEVDGISRGSSWRDIEKARPTAYQEA